MLSQGGLNNKEIRVTQLLLTKLTTIMKAWKVLIFHTLL